MKWEAAYTMGFFIRNKFKMSLGRISSDFIFNFYFRVGSNLFVLELGNAFQCLNLRIFGHE